MEQQRAGQGLSKAFSQPLFGREGRPAYRTACAVEAVDPSPNCEFLNCHGGVITYRYIHRDNPVSRN